ncbi:MAG: transcription antitermination factor NusB [Deltaproteobacteria bacterium]|nr:transcription antitermination factor NusB [Deltaproteobacteria bacterium]
MAGLRRRSREIALQILFKLDANPELAADSAAALYFSELSGAVEDENAIMRSGEPIERDWVMKLVVGVGRERAKLDEGLGQVSRNWRVERMTRVDRCILRLAFYELRYHLDVPTQVVINEAIELAKRYGTAEAAPFVNGILDSAARQFPR